MSAWTIASIAGVVTVPSSSGIASCACGETAVDRVGDAAGGWLCGAAGRTLEGVGMGGVLGVTSGNPGWDPRSSFEAPPVFSTSLGTHPRPTDVDVSYLTPRVQLQASQIMR